MITPLNRYRRAARPRVGDTICNGRFTITAIKNPGQDIGVHVAAIDRDLNTAFLTHNGYRWHMDA